MVDLGKIDLYRNGGSNENLTLHEQLTFDDFKLFIKDMKKTLISLNESPNLFADQNNFKQGIYYFLQAYNTVLFCENLMDEDIPNNLHEL